MQPSKPSDDRAISVPPRGDTTPVARTSDRDAAARVTREQINQIYEQPDPAPTSAAHPYQRTHNDSVAHQAAGKDEELHRYHNAWQQYYQQYYERYYLQMLDSQKRKSPTQIPAHAASTSSFPLEVEHQSKTAQKDETVNEIRNDLLNKVKNHSTQVRKSRHFIPIISAIVVMLLFVLVQYNRIFIAQIKSYVSPGAINAQNIILDPTTGAKVGPEPKLIIPKINVEVPVVYGVGSLENDPVQVALKDGVVHYPIPGANSIPGQNGNTVILGHSSNDVFDDGKYKFIFVQLDQLQTGDTFYINNEGVRYTYSVTAKEVIQPTEVSKLILPTDKPMATLVTCTPIGTAISRLVVYAEQVSPNPTQAIAGPTQDPAEAAAPIPGNAPTLLEQLFR